MFYICVIGKCSFRIQPYNMCAHNTRASLFSITIGSILFYLIAVAHR